MAVAPIHLCVPSLVLVRATVRVLIHGLIHHLEMETIVFLSTAASALPHVGTTQIAWT